MPLKTSLFLLSLAALGWAQAPRVVLDYGTFIGKTDTNIISYRGVRYADAPVGNLRFRAAVFPPSTNLGEVDASQFRESCIQNSQIAQGTSEDCLYGNVFIPASAGTASDLPVLVWFHGGGFLGGDSHISDPNELFADSAEPFILVSFEYRLGPFGFLAGKAIGVDGQYNAGLQDQRTALRWVQRYIGKFGGDPSKVTIWGQSAGAGSTMFHLLANNGNNEGLFRAAIGDSPSQSFMPPVGGDYLETIFQNVVANAGCANSDSAQALSCLRSVDTATLAKAGHQLIASRPATLYAFAPVLDGTFLAARPSVGFSNGKFAKVPVLFGANANDGAHWSSGLADQSANTANPNATETTVFNFIRGQFSTFTRETFDRAIQLYPIANYNNSRDLQGQQMYGEIRYICTSALITGGAAKANIPGFRYFYHNGHLGSDHGAELAALLGGVSASADDKDKALFKAMRQWWTSLVTSGTPTSSLASWPSNNAEGTQRFLLDPAEAHSEITSVEEANRCAFWRSVAEELGN